MSEASLHLTVSWKEGRGDFVLGFPSTTSFSIPLLKADMHKSGEDTDEADKRTR